MMQQQRRPQPQPQPQPRTRRPQQVRRLARSSEGSAARQRNHFARRDLHAAALRAILGGQPHAAMRQQPRPQSARLDHTLVAAAAPKPIIGININSRHLLATLAHQQAHQQQPYSRLPTNSLAVQLMNHRPQIVRQTSDHQFSASAHAGSSLARKLLEQVGPSSATSKLVSKQVQCIKTCKSQTYEWHWQDPDINMGERLLSDDKLEVVFHPDCAESTVAIRGSRPFTRNGNYYYWEVTIYDKIFGTSVMLGLCTEDQVLHNIGYCNLIGLDQHGWSLSHKGYIWHDGKLSRYTDDFSIDQTITVGLFYDTMRGELSYFLNGKNLGVAFSGLNKCNKDLYPVVGSTAKRTRMRLTTSLRGFESLFNRSCCTVLNSIGNKDELVQTLQDNHLPINLIDHLARIAGIHRANR